MIINNIIAHIIIPTSSLLLAPL